MKHTEAISHFLDATLSTRDLASEKSQFAIDAILKTARMVEDQGGELRSRQTICSIITMADLIFEMKKLNLPGATVTRPLEEMEQAALRQLEKSWPTTNPPLEKTTLDSLLAETQERLDQALLKISELEGELWKVMSSTGSGCKHVFAHVHPSPENEMIRLITPGTIITLDKDACMKLGTLVEQIFPKAP